MKLSYGGKTKKANAFKDFIRVPISKGFRGCKKFQDMVIKERGKTAYLC